jgi:hypothetical protein
MIKIKQLKASFIGIKLPNAETQGRDLEWICEYRGDPVDPGPNADWPSIGVELKSKIQESRSANVIGTMNRISIINTPYELSSIYKKMQQQLRVEICDGVVVKEGIFDFSPKYIQDLVKEAYEKGRKLLDVECPPDYVNCTRYGYFEKRRGTRDSYMFRINVKPMKELEALSKSTFNNLFYD